VQLIAFYGALHMKLGAETPDEVTRLSGYLIRSLEDLIDTPPRRPGATPQQIADDFEMIACSNAHMLQDIVQRASRAQGGKTLYPLLTPAAQAAWGRLLARFERLPLIARLLTTCIVRNVREGPAEAQALIAIPAAVLPRLQSADLVYSYGPGLRQWRGRITFDALAVSASTGTLFEGPFASAPRRLILLAYDKVLAGYEERTHSFELKFLLQVRY
jgi:hypothetical protein